MTISKEQATSDIKAMADRLDAIDGTHAWSQDAACVLDHIEQQAARIAEIEKGLKDPGAVHLAMKRGDIAKPSFRLMSDLYGELINGEQAQQAEIQRLRDRIAELEATVASLTEAAENATGILSGQNFPGNSPLVLMARKAMRRIAAMAESSDAIAALIVRDACETDPADPDHDDTICITRDDLLSIVQTHVAVGPQSSGTQGEPLRYTSDGALAECPCCGSLDVGGAHDTVSCYRCGLTVTKPAPLQNAHDAWNERTGRTDPAQGEAVAMRQRFDEIEREIAEGKHTAASVFTQMRTTALYSHPAPQAGTPSCQEIENLAMGNGILKSDEHWGIRYYTNKGSDLFRFARALMSRCGGVRAEPESGADQWRKLAHQFDAQRMQFRDLLRALVSSLRHEPWIALPEHDDLRSLIEQADDALKAPPPAQMNAVLVTALEKIERWSEFPETGKVWEESGNPVSYGAAFGSNGERDYMRGTAREALATYRTNGVASCPECDIAGCSHIRERQASDLARDAARYRFLRDEDSFPADQGDGENHWETLGDLYGAEFDEAVDSLRAQAADGEGQ